MSISRQSHKQQDTRLTNERPNSVSHSHADRALGGAAQAARTHRSQAKPQHPDTRHTLAHMTHISTHDSGEPSAAVALSR